MVHSVRLKCGFDDFWVGNTSGAHDTLIHVVHIFNLFSVKSREDPYLLFLIKFKGKTMYKYTWQAANPKKEKLKNSEIHLETTQPRFEESLSQWLSSIENERKFISQCRSPPTKGN
jgi:hypothetical protein